MAFHYQNSGTNWRLAKSLDVLATEIEQVYPDLICLGTLGNEAHQEQGMASDHNPFILDPATGLGVVRAIDVGGPMDQLHKLRQHLWDLYMLQDPRVYEFGYMKGLDDNLINNWGLPFETHVDTGDSGHLHISLTQVDGYHPSASGYVAAIDSTESWGLAQASQGGTIQIGALLDMDINDTVPAAMNPYGRDMKVGQLLAINTFHTQQSNARLASIIQQNGTLINAVRANNPKPADPAAS